jgi:rfaE bifunctional protein nucleotidyltransferase chain/domain
MADLGKILTLDVLEKERQAARRAGKTFVFTNGCFDILHRGHIELLKTAKSFGDLLAVGLNSDESVKRIKGSRRPITTQENRAAVIAVLEPVDFLVIFDDDTPERLISVLLPDVLVKGSDYALEEIVGRREVERAGGKVVRVPLFGEFSTEEILKDIAIRYKDFTVGSQ